MRNPLNLLKKIGYKKFLLFQLTFGGNIFLPLINPLLWVILILTIMFPEMFTFLLFTEWITVISTMNLICGNLFQIILYLTPVFTEKKYSFIPFAFTIPLYWVLVSAGPCSPCDPFGPGSPWGPCGPVETDGANCWVATDETTPDAMIAMISPKINVVVDILIFLDIISLNFYDR